MYQRRRFLIIFLLSIFQHNGSNAFVSLPRRSSHAAQAHAPVSHVNIISSVPTRTTDFASSTTVLQGSTIHREERPKSSLPKRRLTPEQRKKEWNDRSLEYYATVRRLERSGQKNLEDDKKILQEAHLHYFALTKIRDHNFRHAEVIYRKSVEKKMQQREEEGECDHAALAVSTLLLALHLQRQGKDSETIKKTRSVFLRFFRIVGQDDVQTCACSAKVLQAYALFEMKRGFSRKSVELLKQAVAMDENLRPVLSWKQFRDIEAQLNSQDGVRGASAVGGK